MSSGEAELYPSVRGLAELANLVHIKRGLFGPEWGVCQHYTDASANRAILLRRGAGSLKHIQVKYLWGQDIIRELKVKVVRLDRADMSAHILASPSKAQELENHLQELQAFRS